MNKGKIVSILKDQEKEVCKECDSKREKNQERIADIDECFNCSVHKLVNKVLEALNGS